MEMAMTELAPQERASAGPGLTGPALARLQRPAGSCAAIFLLVVVACAPTVKVEAPKDPITINLNIQADVRVTLEEKAKEDIGGMRTSAGAQKPAAHGLLLKTVFPRAPPKRAQTSQSRQVEHGNRACDCPH